MSAVIEILAGLGAWVAASVALAALHALARARGWTVFAPAGEPLTHMCPARAGEWVTQCCGKSPFSLPTDEPTTPDPALVTCLSWPAGGAR